MQQQADFWKPALISGAIFGFLSGVPILGGLNCLCCCLILGAGVLSSYMMVKDSLMPLAYGRAALGGLFAGMMAALVQSVTNVIFAALMGQNFGQKMQEALDQASQYMGQGEGEEAAKIIASIGLPILLAAATLFLIVIYAGFGALGGVLGRAIFERRPPAPSPSAGVPPAPSGPPGEGPGLP